MYDQGQAASGNTSGRTAVREPGSVELFRDSIRGLIRLALTESSLALTSIPRLIAVCLARVVLFCLGVFGLCLGLALVLYGYSGSVVLATGAFLFPMVTAIVLLGNFQGSLQAELTLPATRAEIEAFTHLLREACNEET